MHRWCRKNLREVIVGLKSLAETHHGAHIEIRCKTNRLIPFNPQKLRQSHGFIRQDILSTQTEAPPVRVETILKIVAEKYSVEVRDLKGRQRTERVSFPRQLAMYLSCRLTNYSTTQVGEAFGGKDHTTVIHARKKIEQLVEKDPFFLENVNKLVARIQSVDNQ